MSFFVWSLRGRVNIVTLLYMSSFLNYKTNKYQYITSQITQLGFTHANM
jgi:hypothetical protein